MHQTSPTPSDSTNSRLFYICFSSYIVDEQTWYFPGAIINLGASPRVGLPRGMASPGLAAAARRHAARVARRTGGAAHSGCMCDCPDFPARAPLRLSSTAEISTTCAPPALAHQRAHASAGHLRLFGRRHSVCGLAMSNPVAFAVCRHLSARQPARAQTAAAIPFAIPFANHAHNQFSRMCPRYIYAHIWRYTPNDLRYCTQNG